MQPYFFPYAGYFQLIKSVDLFVIYDNLKYTKKGWVNRNRFLLSGHETVFSLPLKSDSDFLDIRERTISPGFKKDKLLNKFKAAYNQAPFFEQAFPVFERVIKNQENNLFRFLHYSLREICEYLGIESKFLISSDLQIAHSLKNQEKVIAICKNIGADVYINPIGGIDLYSKDVFNASGINLRFLKSKSIDYKQLGNEFVPWLSIIDVMMFNSKNTIEKFISHGYDLI